MAGRESLPDDNATSAYKCRAGRQYPTNTVIHRQAVVHPVCRQGIHHSGEPMAPLHQTRMAYIGCFRQPCRAGSVDVECPIINSERPKLVAAQRFTRKSLKASVDAFKQVMIDAVNPNRWRHRQGR